MSTALLAGPAHRAPSRAPVIRSRERRPGRERAALLGLLVLAAALDLVGIGGSGWANTYYAAAAQAGATSWHALLYGASDAPASITVDKPPASIWLMALSVRLLGMTPVAIVLPQALLGVATVALVHATVRRLATSPAALLAGLITALTPIATLMFRYDNPDALLTALGALAAYAAVRAIQGGGLRWVLLVGAAFGIGFLTKQLPAFLTLPGLALAYLVAGPSGLLRRIRDLLLAGLALLVSAGWWVALVELVPASSRPYVGGSTSNSFLQLTLGYNGLGRLLGGSGNGAGRSSDPLRVLGDASGQGVAWLLPTALVLGAAVIVLRRGRPRTDAVRAAAIASLLGIILPGVAFGMMSGIYHSYYCVIMVPPIATATALGVAELAQRQGRPAARIALALAVLLTAGWTVALELQGPAALRPLALLVGAAGILGAALLLAPPRARRVRTVAAALALASALAAPTAVSLATAAVPHAGSGPIVARPTRDLVHADARIVQLMQDSAASDGSAHSPTTHWSAAAQGSRVAASYQLASGLPVMPIGGYTRTDPSPTLPEFQKWVREGRVHWYIGDQGEIGSWVAAHYPGQVVDGTPVYDLSAASTA